VKIVVFIDEGHGTDKTFQSCLRNSIFVTSSLSASGFLENTEKSNWVPSKTTTWLGINLIIIYAYQREEFCH